MSAEAALKNCFVSASDDAFLYRIAPDFPAFNGHFPGNPLLPAVCQMGLCADALSRRTGRPLEIKAVGRSKFMRPILPGADVCVTLSPRPDGQFLAELADPADGRKFSQIIFSARVIEEDTL